jgi:hypothetical protein
MRFEVLTLGTMKITIVYDVAPCDLLKIYRLSGNYTVSIFYPEAEPVSSSEFFLNTGNTSLTCPWNIQSNFCSRT